MCVDNIKMVIEVPVIIKVNSPRLCTVLTCPLFHYLGFDLGFRQYET